jgi:hypothetical protein
MAVVIVRYGILITTLDVVGCILEPWLVIAMAKVLLLDRATARQCGGTGIWQRLDILEKPLYVFLAIT